MTSSASAGTTSISETPRLRVRWRLQDFLRDEQGVEAYYNYALTPWAMLSPDIQFVRPTLKDE